MIDREFKQIDNLRHLFLSDVPLLDVRAPIEFAAGAFPTATNLPLMNDVEREEIGIHYKQQGQDAAIDLGHELVSGPIRDHRIAAWTEYLQQHPAAALYCFRGGQRSRISQQWLRDVAGIDCPRVHGGYKAMRRFLLDELEHNSAHCRPVVIGGRTGVGKTRLLARCESRIDLEQLARHRGSAFGRHPEPQPTQIDFENALAIALLKKAARHNAAFVVEDESRNIGSRHVPPVFYDALQRAPLILLEATDDERVDITLQEYVHDALGEFVAIFGPSQGFEHWSAYLSDSLDRIRKRLGGDRHARAQTLLKAALSRHTENGDTDGHRAWIAYLLHEYYDGMYSYQLQGKSERIVYRGRADEVLAYLAEHHAIPPRAHA